MAPQQPNDNSTGTHASEFRKYIKQVRENKKEGYTAIIFYLLAGIIIYICYPYPDIMPDTGSYLNFVYPRVSYGGPRPLGYSLFLSFLRDIYAGTGIIFLVQYIIYCLASFFFYSSTVYIFSIERGYLRYSYFAFSLVFVSGMYTSNMIMSDSLFASLTLLLLAFCLWLLYTAEKRFVIPLVLITLIIIPVRYIGMIYPVMVIPVLFLSFKKKMLPVIASSLILLFIYGYANKVKVETMNDQQVEVFSGFSGWQQANNALHVIPHIDLNVPVVESWDDSSLVFIDRVVRKSYVHNRQLYPAANEVGYPFIWTDSLPLRIVFNTYRGNTNARYRNKYYTDWNRLGKIYYEYGNLLIQQYFPEYLYYYIYNNAVRSLHPPVEIFESYNQMKDTHIMKLFFGWDNDGTIEARYDILRPILLSLSWIYTIYWCLFGIGLIMIVRLWLFKRGLFKNKELRLVFLLTLFVIGYTAANIYAAPINLRFLIPVRPAIIGIFFIMLHITTRKEERQYSNN